MTKVEVAGNKHSKRSNIFAEVEKRLEMFEDEEQQVDELERPEEKH